MGAVRRLIWMIGIAMVVLGGLWSLQGLGLLAWPSGTFLFARGEWALAGALTLAAGTVMLLRLRPSARCGSGLPAALTNLP